MIKNTLLTSFVRPVIYGPILAFFLIMATGAVGAEDPNAVAPTYQTGVVDNTGTTPTPPPAAAPLAGAPDTSPEADLYAPAPATPKQPRATSPSGDDPYAVAPSVETGAVGDPRQP